MILRALGTEFPLHRELPSSVEGDVSYEALLFQELKGTGAKAKGDRDKMQTLMSGSLPDISYLWAYMTSSV